MNEQQDNGNYNTFTQGFNNQGYNTSSALHLRLNPEPMLEQFKVYLSGRETITTEDGNGNAVTQVLWEGTPLVNERGFQSIMQTLSIIISTPAVQGNFIEPADYENYLCRCRKDIATDLMDNRKKYGINTSDYDAIISRMMRIIEVYMSRLIHDRERSSYANSLRVQESTHTQPSKGFNIPFVGGKI